MVSATALEVIRSADLLLSPMVLLELEYLSEIGRVQARASEALIKLEHESRVRLCDLPLLEISQVALNEKWTRDPFDRLIVAQAKANGFASLLSADREIAAHYPRTVW